MRRLPCSWNDTLTSLGFKRRPRKRAGQHSRAGRRFEELERRQVLATVADVHLFYNNSAFDGYTEEITAADTAAIATDKVALRELEQATFANYSSYHRGVNGVMIDLVGGKKNVRLKDFEFKQGLEGEDGQIEWVDAPLPTGFAVQQDAGEGGADRVVLTWDDDSAVKNGWLEVTVTANRRTRLATDETFYFGSAVGETGNQAGSTLVNGSDYVLARRSLRSLADPAAVDEAFDINRDRQVDGSDLLLIRRNFTSGQTDLAVITPELVAADNLSVEVLSPSEIFVRWHDRSSAEGGYRLTVRHADGSVAFTHDSPADATGRRFIGLSAGADYTVELAPIGVAPSGEAAVGAAISTSFTTAERLTNNDSGPGWYKISLDGGVQEGDAGFSHKEGDLSLKEEDLPANVLGGGYIYAESLKRAVLDAVEGVITIEDKDEETFDFDVENNGAYDVRALTVTDENDESETKDRIVLEDTTGWSNNSWGRTDADYDDWYVDFTAEKLEVSIDLIAKGPAGESGGELSENDEDTTGGFLPYDPLDIVGSEDDGGTGKHNDLLEFKIKLNAPEELINKAEALGSEIRVSLNGLLAYDNVDKSNPQTSLTFTGAEIGQEIVFYVEATRPDGLFGVTARYDSGAQGDPGVEDYVKLTAFTWSGPDAVPEGTGSYDYQIRVPGSAPAGLMFDSPSKGTEDLSVVLPPPPSTLFQQSITWDEVAKGTWGALNFTANNGWQWTIDDVAIVDVSLDNLGSGVDYAPRSDFIKDGDVFRITTANGGIAGAEFKAEVLLEGPRETAVIGNAPGEMYGADAIEVGFIQNVKWDDWRVKYKSVDAGGQESFGVWEHSGAGQGWLLDGWTLGTKPWYDTRATTAGYVQSPTADRYNIGPSRSKLSTSDTPRLDVARQGAEDEYEAIEVIWEGSFRLHVAAHAAGAPLDRAELFYSAGLAKWSINATAAVIDDPQDPTKKWNLSEATTSVDSIIDASSETEFSGGGELIYVVDGDWANDYPDGFTEE